MIQFLTKIRNKGINESTKRVEAKRIRLLNDIMLVFLSFQIVSYVDFIARGSWLQVIFVFFSQILVATPIILNSYQKYNSARWFFIFTMILQTFLIKISHGPEVRILPFYFLVGITATFFFDAKWRRILVGIIILTSYVGSEYYVLHYPAPLADVVTPVYNFLVFTGVMLICLIIVAYFVDDNNIFEEKTNLLLHELQAKNTNLEINQTKIEQQNKELERFAYIASHDLKTPLRSITSFLGLLNRKLKHHQDNDVHEYLNYAKNSSQQMHILVEDILEFSRLGQEKASLTKVDLDEVLQTAIKNLKSVISEKNVILDIQDLPTVLGNAPRLGMVFQNIIENGIKYNQNQAPEIKISYSLVNYHHQIAIQDNGIGIAKEHFNRIFEMFKRLHTQVEYRGSGIGLAICKKIVEQHGGAIKVESEVGVGTSFVLIFPEVG